MDEEALNDAYTLFNQSGYKGDIKAFQKLISTNEGALKDAHALFASSGYKGDIDKFSTLIGVGSKKKVPTGLPSTLEGGALPAPFTGDGKLPPKQVEEQKIKKDKDIPYPNLIDPKGFGVIPEQIVDTPVADLYDQYKEAGVITPVQQRGIDTEFKRQQKGDRGWWETLNALADGMLATGLMIPLYQFNSREELLEARGVKNRIDFLEALPEEKVKELNSFAVRGTGELSKESRNVFAENTIIQEKSKSLVNNIRHVEDAITRAKQEGEEISIEGIKHYRELIQELKGMEISYNQNVDILESDNEQIGSFVEELDFLKKNYGGLEYYQDLMRLSGADIVAGISEFGSSTMKMSAKVNPLAVAPAAQWEAFNKEFREEIGGQREFLKPVMSVSDIDDARDFGAWLTEQTATQLPVIAVLAAGGSTVGLTVLGTSAAGQKMGEMRDKGGYSETEMYLTGIGYGAAEVLSERVSLGILSKGKRALKSLKTPALKTQFKEGVKRFMIDTPSEGLSEFGNQMAQNMIDIMYLGDEDVHILDGTLDALASGTAMGGAMSATPTLIGMGAKAFLSREVGTKVTVDIKVANELLSEVEMKGETLAESTKDLMTSKAKKLIKGASKTIDKAYKDVSNLEKPEIKKLIDIDKQADKLLKGAKAIQESELDPTIKKDLIKDLQVKAEKLREQKTELLEDAKKTKKVRPEGEPVEVKEPSVGDLPKIDKPEAAPKEKATVEKVKPTLPPKEVASKEKSVSFTFLGEKLTGVKQSGGKIKGTDGTIYTEKMVKDLKEVDVREDKPLAKGERRVPIVKEEGAKRILKHLSKRHEISSTLVDMGLFGTRGKFDRQALEISINKSSTLDDKGNLSAALESTGNISRRTIFHEYLHPFSEILEKANPALYEEIHKKALEENSKSGFASIEHYPESQKKEEMVVRYLDRLSDKDKSHTLLNRFVDWISELFYGKRLNNKESLQKLSSETTVEELYDVFKKYGNLKVEVSDIIREDDINREISLAKSILNNPDIPKNIKENYKKELKRLEESKQRLDTPSPITEPIASPEKTLTRKQKLRQFLAGVPGITLIDKTVFEPLANKMEDFIAKKVTEGLQHRKSLVRGIAQGATSWFNGLPRTDQQLYRRRRVKGLQEAAYLKGVKMTQELQTLINNDPEAAKRVHSALDPEIYDETDRVTYDELNLNEKALFDALRDINNQTHELNYALDLIPEDTYQKYKGNYIGRGYDIYEQAAQDIENRNFVGTKLDLNIYKQRKEIDQWKIDNTVTDPIYLTINRMIKTQRNAAVKAYSSFISKQNKLVSDEVRPGFTKLEGKVYGDLSGKYVLNYIAEDFKGYFYTNAVMDSLYDAVKLYDKIELRQFLKKYHTVYSPVVQIGNFMSNNAFAFASGINIVELWGNIPSARKDIMSKTGDYVTMLENGIIGSNVLTGDLTLSKSQQEELKLDSKKRNLAIRAIKKLDKKAQDTYAHSDDLMKVAAYKALRQTGLTEEQAVKRVFEGFQNYATVGKFWDFASKMPIFGNAFIKFQADLQRIVKNAVTKRPLTTAAFLGSLKLIAQLLSEAYGESEEERRIREERSFIPKIEIGNIDIPLVFKVGSKEINLARFISPYYNYDIPEESWLEKVTKLTPFQIREEESKELGQTQRYVDTPDVLLGSIWAAFMNDKDFRGKSISDPYATRYKESGLTGGEKFINRLEYVSRSVVPLFSTAQDLYKSSQYGEDFYGRDKSVVDILLSKFVKMQTFEGESYKKEIQNKLKSINYKQRIINSKIKSIKKRATKDMENIQRRIDKGILTNAKGKAKMTDIYNSANDRISSQLLRLTKQQERLNKVLKDTPRL